MAAELATPRHAAPYLGTSMVTWTWTLAVWLAGLAMGSLLLGRLVDRRRGDLSPLLLLTGAALLALAVPLAPVVRGLALPEGLRAPTALVLLYGPAAFVLGGVTPALARRLLRGGHPAGRTLGLLSGAGAFGSVVGTLLTGFVWIPHAGVSTLHWGVAAVLAGTALLVWPGARASGRDAAAAPSTHTARATRDPSSGPWTALAAITGASILALESLAGRLTTLHLGASVFTWTSVIAVVLTGLAIGAVWGGRLADRMPPQRLVYRLLVVASALCATALWTPALLERFAAALPGPWAVRVLLGSATAWLAPSIVLGMVSPALTRAALRDPASDGRVVGRMVAAGTLGSVAAAVVVPLVLIPWLQTSAVALATSLVLAGSALWLGAPKREDAESTSRIPPLLPWCATLLVLLVVARAPFTRTLGVRLGLRADAPDVWVADSQYFHIQVAPAPTRWARFPGGLRSDGLAADPVLAGRVAWDAEGSRVIVEGPLDDAVYVALSARLLDPDDHEALDALAARTKRPLLRMAIDRLVHGFVDPADPTWLEYEYERVTAAVVGAHASRSDRATDAYPMLFLGGGTYTFQRHARATYEDRAHMTTLEIDPVVTEAAQVAMALPTLPQHTIRHGDARTWLAADHGADEPGAAAGDGFALILGDVFHDIAVPWHLTTRECFTSIREKLRPGGIYVMNVVDDPASGPFLGAIDNTLSLVFKHTAAFITRGNAGAGRDTVLFVASESPIPDLLETPVSAGEATRATADTRKAWRAAAEALILTDDYAPVEWLLAPVFIARGAGPR